MDVWIFLQVWNRGASEFDFYKFGGHLNTQTHTNTYTCESIGYYFFTYNLHGRHIPKVVILYNLCFFFFYF